MKIISAQDLAYSSEEALAFSKCLFSIVSFSYVFIEHLWKKVEYSEKGTPEINMPDSYH